jgi:hypothetical protein
VSYEPSPTVVDADGLVWVDGCKWAQMVRDLTVPDGRSIPLRRGVASAPTAAPTTHRSPANGHAVRR